MFPSDFLLALLGAASNANNALDNIKTDLLDLMAVDAKNLIIMRLIGEKMQIWDSVTFADYLNRYASEYYKEAKDLDVMALLDYWKDELNGGRRRE